MDLATAKFIVRAVVTLSVGWTVTSLLKQNIAPETKIQKTELAIGSLAMSYVAGEHIGHLTDGWVDSIANLGKEEDPPVVIVH